MKCLLACLSLHRLRCDRTGENKAKMGLHRKRGALAELSSLPSCVGVSWTQMEDDFITSCYIWDLKTDVWLLSVYGSKDVPAKWRMGCEWRMKLLKEPRKNEAGDKVTGKIWNYRVWIQFFPLPTSAQQKTKHPGLGQHQWWWSSSPKAERPPDQLNTTPQQHLLPRQPNIPPAPKTPEWEIPKPS